MNILAARSPSSSTSTAGQARIVTDVWLRLALSELPTDSLANDPRARSALFAMDWDRHDNTTQFEIVTYQLANDGQIAFDPEPLPLPPGIRVGGRLPALLRRAMAQAPRGLAMPLARQLKARGHGVMLVPSGQRIPPWHDRSQVEPRRHLDGPEIDL